MQFHSAYLTSMVCRTTMKSPKPSQLATTNKHACLLTDHLGAVHAVILPFSCLVPELAQITLIADPVLGGRPDQMMRYSYKVLPAV